ncbi:MAG: hypothetical protein GX061_01925 [Eubacteriaceae bacterium]|nr:hypothetical protein [Eubacteriaceae bacterium]
MSTLTEYKCPSCGGALEFNSQVQKMKCPYCGSEFEMEALKPLDSETDKPIEDNMKWDITSTDEWQEGETEKMTVYICKSCGGEIIADDTTAATSCPYCDNPVVINGKFSQGLRPNVVIPFKYDKKQAKEQFKKHLTGKKLLPKVFKTENHLDEIKGIYVPFWLLDAGAEAQAIFRTTRIRKYSDKNYDYVESSYYDVYRAGSLGFEHIPVDSSTKMPDKLMESIEPFSYEEAVDFQTAYLAGYLADKYDVSVEESEQRANNRVKNTIGDALKSTVTGYDIVTNQQMGVQLYNGKAVYALYPVWILNTTWNKQKYTFAMNGQTGKFVGDLPLDKNALKKYLGIITAAGTAAVMCAAYLLYLL